MELLAFIHNEKEPPQNACIKSVRWNRIVWWEVGITKNLRNVHDNAIRDSQWRPCWGCMLKKKLVRLTTSLVLLPKAASSPCQWLTPALLAAYPRSEASSNPMRRPKYVFRKHSWLRKCTLHTIFSKIMLDAREANYYMPFFRATHTSWRNFGHLVGNISNLDLREIQHYFLLCTRTSDVKEGSCKP